MINLDDICSKVMNLCFEVGEFIISEKSKINLQNTEIKGIHNFVTYVDKASEKRLVGELSLILPESGFIAEEGTSNKIGKEFNWIIDPLDGTTNFIHGLSPFCISIALRQNDKIVLGVIYDPNLKEIFYAWEGGSAFLNGKVINVSKSNKLDNSLLATGFPYSDYSMLQNYLKVFEWCLLNTHGVRRLGSAAIDLAYVACGRMDGFFEYGLSPWDVAAGAFIVEKAGGKVTDFSGDIDYVFGKEIIASNLFIHSEFIENFKMIFYKD